MAQTTLAEIEDQIRHVAQNLYNLIVQSYDHQGAATETAMKREIASLMTNLHDLITSAPNLSVKIPQEVIQYVQEGRNPDIYTREYMETLMKANQMHSGKTDAFGRFRDVLAMEFVGAVPEVRGEVERVLRRSGGDASVLSVKDEQV